jgi:hypothetical protein
MAFTERQEYKLEIIPPFQVIQCRRADIVEKDGVEVGRTYFRFIRCPGEDVTNDPAQVQAVANALWTPEVIDAFQAHLSSHPGPGGLEA